MGFGDYAGGIADGLVSGAQTGIDLRDAKNRSRRLAMEEARAESERILVEQERQLRDQEMGIVRGVRPADRLPKLDDGGALFGPGDPTLGDNFSRIPTHDVDPGFSRGPGDRMGGPARMGGMGLGMQGDQGIPDLAAEAHNELIRSIGDRPQTLIPYEVPYAYQDQNLLNERLANDPDFMAERANAEAEYDARTQSAAAFQQLKNRLSEQYPEAATLIQLATDENGLRTVLNRNVDDFMDTTERRLRAEAEAREARNGAGGGGEQNPDMTLTQAMGHLRAIDGYYDGESYQWRFPLDEIRAEAARFRAGEPTMLLADEGEPDPGSEGVAAGRAGFATEDEVRQGYLADLDTMNGIGPNVKTAIREAINDPEVSMVELQRLMSRYMGPPADVPAPARPQGAAPTRPQGDPTATKVGSGSARRPGRAEAGRAAELDIQIDALQRAIDSTAANPPDFDAEAMGGWETGRQEALDRARRKLADLKAEKARIEAGG